MSELLLEIAAAVLNVRLYKITVLSRPGRTWVILSHNVFDALMRGLDSGLGREWEREMCTVTRGPETFLITAVNGADIEFYRE